jgi:tRNA(Leu) C34 or U34 (ribose-2'-O)-methylase TrmL
VLVLDSLEDPQNFGTLLRSAEAVGVHGVVFPTRRQAPLTPAAIKASAGATEHLLLVPVDDLAAALAELHLRGLRIVGGEADAPLSIRGADLRGPLAVVVGSEGHGLSPAVRRRCDLTVRIPLRGSVQSLNAAVAGSLLLFEAVGQREAGGAGAESDQPIAGASPTLAAPGTTTEGAPEDPARPAPGTAAPAGAGSLEDGSLDPAPEPAAPEPDLLPGEPRRSPRRRPPAGPARA